MTFDSRARLRRTLLGSAVAAVALPMLSGCAPLLVGGAMIGGSLMVSDRRTSGAQVEDEAIELKALRRLSEAFGDKAHVNVTSYNRVVLLTGEVATEADKARVEQLMQRVDNVRSIVNEVGVMPVSSFTSRSNDSLLTGRVKASLVEAKDLMAQAFKVVTERRTVYLMGVVTEREAVRAAEIASRVSGVHKVVRVFDIVSEAELAGKVPKQQ
ncbi:BON domain-containing protein [Piscinibacter sakaiensis]|uniref:BON domain-containing protein n=1 Tax=Piscinibacter sakaiensis TaxID=1547922 RepID=UPI003AAB891F